MIKIINKNLLRLAIFALLTLSACASKPTDWQVSYLSGTPILNKDIVLKIQDTNKNAIPDSIIATIEGIPIAQTENSNSLTIPKNAIKTVGQKTININVVYKNYKSIIQQNITILSDKRPKEYTYKIVNTYPHSTTAFCQGLEYNYLQNNDTFFESTGLYGESKLKVVDIKTGKTLKEVDLSNHYFGEGLTVFNNRLILLTWRENTGFIYNPLTLEQIGTFTYQASKEGWGLTNDGTNIYKSDGTENIWLLDPTTLKETSHIQVYDNKGPVRKLNELEYINGYIYANVFQTNDVVIIDPNTGIVEGVIDLRGLLKPSDITPETNVLNGIAYDKNKKRLFVTGKKWPKLFQIEILSK